MPTTKKQMTDASNIHPASFKDPAGFIFQHEGKILRQVNKAYANHYNLLMNSGLYDTLVKKKRLLPHAEIENPSLPDEDWFKTLFPEQLEYTSYAYEWSFDMLKDAALCTLSICKSAMKKGMILKDATPYNIQFHKGNPVLIDTLSFEQYDETQPWIAYRQFCGMFLFPLLIEHYTGFEAKKLLISNPDGITVTDTAAILPFRSRFNLGVWLHVNLQKKISSKKEKATQQGGFSKAKLERLLLHLESIIQNLHIPSKKITTWSNYYAETILSEKYLQAKDRVVRSFLDSIAFDTALDIGTNDGYFSKIVAEKNKPVIATDFDDVCINQLYLYVKEKKISNILPLIIDIANPSPAIGLNNNERSSFSTRTKTYLVTALALIHHLVFGKNIPLSMLPGIFAPYTTKYLLIEFVPFEDEKVQTLVKHKTNFHEDYTAALFEEYFATTFIILKKEAIAGSERILYLLQKKES